MAKVKTRQPKDDGPIVPRLTPTAIKSLGRGRAHDPKKGHSVPYKRERRDWKRWDSDEE
ncbi:MAG: hypothetical protein HY813_00085 [Candidatus Portnoybacteria bacterium]|nr:hypothetical protein [Candidatus Portnoybacteria bacterium]